MLWSWETNSPVVPGHLRRLSHGTAVELRLNTGDSGGKLTPPRMHRVLRSKGVKDARGGAHFSRQLEGEMLAYHLQLMEARVERSQDNTIFHQGLA